VRASLPHYQVRASPPRTPTLRRPHRRKQGTARRSARRERLHISEEGLSKPWVSATSGALSTAVGAFIPVIPFFFMSGIPAIVVAAIISLLAHFAVGASSRSSPSAPGGPAAWR